MEAVALTQALQPDVVVMDVRMPDMDGIEAARLINEACPTPVIVLTAYDTAELLDEASRAGVGMYLVKPTTAPELDHAIAIAMSRFNDMIELRRLNEELQARNEELNAFSHTVAHDLKNPLQFIINYADLLREDWRELPDEEIERRLNLIEQNGLRMSNIIDELLLLAEARQMEVTLSPLDMASIVAEAQSRLAYLIERHEAKVRVPSRWPLAIGYAPWVEEVWVNYLSNALRYGGRPPRIELGAEVQPDGMVRFWIRDNGPGIEPEERERLFRPFTRLDQVNTKGHGLGLSIVRSIVEKLGGEVWVKSGVGEGSTFSFTLPPADS
jgi:signal transduction histidine kinase